MRRQPRLPHGLKRVPKSGTLHPIVADLIHRDMKRFNCGASWVIATALEEHYRKVYSERFYESDKPKGRKNA